MAARSQGLAERFQGTTSLTANECLVLRKTVLPIKSSYPHFSRWLRSPTFRDISEDDRFNLPRFPPSSAGRTRPPSGSAARSSFRITSVVGFAVCPLPVTFLTRSEAREKTELYTYQRLHIR